MGRCDIGSCRNRNRNHAVLAPDLAVALRQRRYHNLLYSQVVETDCHADDIDNGIDRSHLMKMNLINGKTVGLCFRLCYNQKHVLRQFLHCIVGIQAAYDFINI